MNQLNNDLGHRRGEPPMHRPPARAAANGPADSGSVQTELRRLQEELRRERAEDSYRQLQRRIVEFIRVTVPRGSTALVISKGDDELMEIPGRRGWHFPRAVNGLYAGCYPGDSREAVEHLRKLRSQGAEYLAIPTPSFWWLEFYPGLTRRLVRRHRMIAFHEEICIVFKLSSGHERDELSAFADNAGPR